MFEDDVYRTSTQYRYWSYTPRTLAALRANTNAVAADRVRVAIKRSRAVKQAGSDSLKNNNESQESDIECLTVEEELKLIKWGCSRILDIGEAMEPPIPFPIRATAIQFLRRFYLTNSPMTYHPKQIMMCALFLATKTDHYHIGLSRFVSKLPNVKEEDIKAPEFLLMQGLRFTLDVRHPMVGLDGGIMELRAMASSGQTSVDFARLLKEAPGRENHPQRRIDAAEHYAQKTLHGAAQMTDAYFLYTPSQIWLAALWVADDALGQFFLDAKTKSVGAAFEPIKSKVVATIKSCAELLKAYESEEEDSNEKKELRRIGKKLHLCQNPEKVDLVEITKAQKREGTDGSDAEKALKKRKLERERLNRDGDVFGGELRKSTAGTPIS